jgi:hypothetical protein
MLNNLLVMRLAVINICAMAGVAYAWQHGLVQMVYAADTSYICYAITALFAVGLLSVFQRALKVSRALNFIKTYRMPLVNGAKFTAKGDHIADIAQWLAVLGLTGTVVGFIMALNDINVDGDPKAMVAQLIGGMAVAFYTTLAGGVTGLWLELNNRILRTATACMIEDAK